MRKNDLIRKLQQLKGNPEVMLWNGIVGDFMPVGKIVESTLVKQTKEYYFETCRLEDCRDAGNWTLQLSDEEKQKLSKYYSSFQYEDNPYVTEEDIKLKRYKQKRVIAIDAKQTGKRYQDHRGHIDY